QAAKAAAPETAKTGGPTGPDVPKPAREKPGLLVETAWLDENIIRPEMVIVDLRTRENFEQGHIPGACHLDESRLLKREGSSLSLPSPDEIKEIMESVGVGEGAQVIAVDDFGGTAAARLWWTLGYNGFDDVSLLNGGYEKWQTEGRATTFDQPYPRKA